MSTERYNASLSEKKCQAAWEDQQAFRAETDHSREKYYVLEMFPYPSGAIHMGHVRNYTLGDVVARYKRAQGFNVLHPIGWDAFGLPAENAAFERKVHPADWTYKNIDAMRDELKSMGLSIDWSREFATCDPEYYEQQQRMFIEMYRKGLVYQKESWVNWDPVENTVLANEQVVDGRGWRSGAPVERRQLSQWFLKITEYADDLLAALDGLDRWPDRVRLMQANWIGKSEGAEVTFGLTSEAPDGSSGITVFTTRPDTLYGASFIAIAANHPLAVSIAEKDMDAEAFLAECASLGTSEAAVETAEKRGYDTGLKVRHPFVEGHHLPVYIANFVLMEYGTGAIFGCPAHDQRDLDFANTYDLPVLPVVLPDGEDPAGFTVSDTAYTGPGQLFNSADWDGLSVEDGKRAAISALEGLGSGTRQTTYRLRDWGLSRQRYWGCPIPVVRLDKIYRQDESSSIVANAHLILKGESLAPDEASSSNQARPPPWALACLLVWALLVAQPRSSAAPAVIALPSPTRAQAARWAYRRVARRMWRAMQPAPQPTPNPPAAPDRISRLEQNLVRAQDQLDQLRDSANRHTATLRSLASDIQQQVASATAASTIPPGLTAALSTAQALLSRRHPPT